MGVSLLLLNRYSVSPPSVRGRTGRGWDSGKLWLYFFSFKTVFPLQSLTVLFCDTACSLTLGSSVLITNSRQARPHYGKRPRHYFCKIKRVGNIWARPAPPAIPAAVFCPLPPAGGCSNEARSRHRLPLPSFQGLFHSLGPMLPLVLTCPLVLVTSSRLYNTGVVV